MKEHLKKFLKKFKLYHPLQAFYRGVIAFASNNYYKLLYSRYKGKGFSCNFCGATYQKFVPEFPSSETSGAIGINEVIAGYGENVYCPNCLSKNRERLVLAVIQNMLSIEHKTILHFSPEKHLYNYLKSKTVVTTVDLEPGFYRNIDSAISYANATNLRFNNESFDMIIANHVLEHIPDDAKAMNEMYRVLKTGGTAILQVPYSERLPTTIEEPFIRDPKKQERLFGQKDHVRIYSLSDYTKRLKTAGFQVNVLSPQKLEQFKVNGIQENESVILCYK
ncbi:MAG: Methyltransferase type 11 [Segetibacter sp.]|nr:Methyltransferase type 11 [Segetibacter sp.]